MTRARRFSLPRRHGSKVHPPKRPSRRLFVEPLEDRRVMAAITGVVNAGTLELTGDAAANTLAVSVAAGTLNLTAAAGTIDLTALGLGDVAAQAVDLAAEGITKVKIDLAGDGDTVNFGAVAANPALTEIRVEDTGAAGADAVNVNGVMSVGGGFIISGVEATLLASNVTTTGAQTYNGPVTLGANVVLVASTVTFNGTVAGGGNSLGITGNAVFGDAAADTVTGVSTLSVSGTTTINTNTVTTTDTQTYSGAATIGATAGTAVLTATNRDVTFGNTAILLSNLTINSGDGNITFTGTVDGGFALIVNGTGATPFIAPVGNGTALASLTTNLGAQMQISANVTTTGDQIYNNTVRPLGVVTLRSMAGNISFNGNVSSFSAGSVTAQADSSTKSIAFNSSVLATLTDFFINTPGTTIVNASFTAQSLSTDVGGTTQINNNVAADDQTYNDPVVIGADAAFSGTNLTFATTINDDGNAATSSNLFFNVSGNLKFEGLVGDIAALTRLRTIGLGQTQINGGGAITIRTSGEQRYSTATKTLGANTTLTSTAGGIIELDKSVNGSFSLAVNTSGSTILGQVGGATALTTITTDAPGSTTLGPGPTSIRTSGNQTYNDNVTLSANTAITASTVTFNGTVAGGSNSLTITGNAVFGDAAADTVTQLTTLTVTGTTTINTTQVGSTGTQTYNDSVTIGSNTNLTTGNVVFEGTINSAPATNHSLSILATGTVNFNAAVGNSQPLGTLTVTADGAITASDDITSTGNVHLTANESPAVDANNITLASGATVATTAGNVSLSAGDNITVLGGVTASAGIINITSTDAADAPAAGPSGVTGTVFTLAGTLNATQINVTGSAANDVFEIAFAQVTGAVVVRGGANDATLAPGVIRDTAAADVPALTKTSKSPFFLPTVKSFVVGDQLFVDDNGLTPADNLNRDYTIDGIQIRRVGDATSFVTFPDHDLELLKLTTGRGNNDITANMAANGALPTIVQVDTAGAQSSPADDRFQVLGTAGGDKISIGDIDLHSSLSSGPLGPIRAHFELNGVQRQWVQSFAGDDVIDNISSVPGLLDGGAGKDAINSIVNHSSSFKLAKKIENSVPKNVTLVLGNEDADKLYVGAGFIDKGVAVTPLITALKNFPDLGITFLIGDHSVVANKLTPVALAKQKGDNYASSASAFQHGFIALKDFSDPAPAPNTSLGSFRFGAGDKVKFSKTIAWLKAQLFVGAAVPLLLKSLNTQVAEYTRPVTDAAGEGSLLDLSEGEASSMPVLDARIDVNRDGHISPVDALLIINDLNASGSRKLPTLEIGEGEDSLEEESTPILDVNDDSYLTPLDALLVINVLNILGKPEDVNAEAADEFIEENAEDDLAAPATAINSPSTAAASAEAIFSLLASDWLAAERRRQEAAAALI